MKLAGCFNSIEGLILGAFEECGVADDIFKIVGDIFKGDTIPILAGLEVGHGKRNLPIPTGLKATLDADRKLLSFHEPATSQ